MSLYDPKNPPRAVIVPEHQPPGDREAFFASLYAEHGDFILQEARRRANLQPASAEDVRQRVAVIFHDHLHARVEEQKMSHDEVRAYLGGVIWKVARNYTRERGRRLPGGADAELVVCSAMDPERAAALAEHRAKVRRYFAELPLKERRVLQLIDLEGNTLKQAAAELGLALGSVSTLHTRARKNLREIALASERATRVGRRRAVG